MTRLNQIIAVEKGVKAEGESVLTKAYHDLTKVGPWAGIARVYTPKDEEGDRLPAETTLVQLKGEDVLSAVAVGLTRLFDITATKDAGNTVARADVVIDGVTILSQVPVTTLLFLEKKLVDLGTFLSKFPVLDPADTWTFDTGQRIFRADPVETNRTKKILRNHVKAEATDKHPAQVEVYHEDTVVGTWKTTKFSGALEESTVKSLRDRVRRLSEAVKKAREEANSMEVDDVHIGEAVFTYLAWTDED
jgi:hypothetical protein